MSTVPASEWRALIARRGEPAVRDALATKAAAGRELAPAVIDVLIVARTAVRRCTRQPAPAPAPAPQRRRAGEDLRELATGRCPAGCGRPVAWARTVNGARIALDPLASPTGNVAVRTDVDGELLARVVSRALPLLPYERCFATHFATCPMPRPRLARVLDLAGFRRQRAEISAERAQGALF